MAEDTTPPESGGPDDANKNTGGIVHVPGKGEQKTADTKAETGKTAEQPADDTARDESRAQENTGKRDHSKRRKSSYNDTVRNKDDLYATLGFPDDRVRKTITEKEIKRAYRDAAHATHPDQVERDGLTEEQVKAAELAAEEKFKAVNDAYSILSNPGKRKEYDAKFAAQDFRTQEQREQEKKGHSDNAGQRPGAESTKDQSGEPKDAKQAHSDYIKDLLERLRKEAKRKFDEEYKAAQSQKRPADFSNIDISHMDLSGLDLTNAKFSHPKRVNSIYKTNFTNAKLDGADFSNCDISFSTFDKITLNNAKFATESLSYSSFDQVDMTGTQFTGNVHGNEFKNANLEKASFKEQKNFEFNKFKDSKLMGTDFTGSNFCILTLQGNNDMTGAVFTNTKGYNSYQLIPKDQSLIKLGSASFNGATVNSDMYKSDLTGADLRGVKATLYAGAMFRESILDNAQITEGPLADAAIKNAASCKGLKVFDKDGVDVSAKYAEKITTQENARAQAKKQTAQNGQNAAPGAGADNKQNSPQPDQNATKRFSVTNPKTSLGAGLVATVLGVWIGIKSLFGAKPQVDEDGKETAPPENSFLGNAAKAVLALALAGGGAYLAHTAWNAPNALGQTGSEKMGWAKKIIEDRSKGTGGPGVA